MPIILESKHRLLHMRAFLTERNRGQSKTRFIFDGLSFHSQSMSLRREKLMATDMGKSQETKSII